MSSITIGISLIVLILILLIVLFIQSRQERKNYKLSFQVMEKRFRTLFTNSPDAILLENLEGDIIDANISACDLFETTLLKLIGTKLSRHIKLVGDQNVLRDFHQLIRHEIPYLQGSFVNRSGKTVLVEMKAAKTRYQDDDVILIHLRDVSVRVRIEQELRKSKFELEQRVASRTADLQDANELLEKEIEQREIYAEKLTQQTIELENSNQELEQFAYVASHDLKEPLRTIISFIQLLERNHVDKTNEEAKEFIDFVVDGAKRMDRLISDLLKYSRVGNAATKEQLDFNLVLDKICLLLRNKISESETSIMIHPLPILTANKLQMEQLFQNLMDNAIKFQNGKQPKIEVNAEDIGDFWKFSVKDNGVGIAPKRQDAIFTLFHRLHSAQNNEGTGIGLAICKKIVEQHNGKIWVESMPEQGTTFYFTLHK